jgi:hypothetical protein
MLISLVFCVIMSCKLKKVADLESCNLNHLNYLNYC